MKHSAQNSTHHLVFLIARVRVAAVLLTLVLGGCAKTGDQRERIIIKPNSQIGSLEVPERLARSGSAGGTTGERCLDLPQLISSNILSQQTQASLQINHSDVAWLRESTPLNAVNELNPARTAGARDRGEVFKSIAFFAGSSDDEVTPTQMLEGFFDNQLGFRVASQNDCEEVETTEGDELNVINHTTRSLTIRKDANQVVKFDLVTLTSGHTALRIRSARRQQTVMCSEASPTSGVLIQEYLINPESERGSPYFVRRAFIDSLRDLTTTSMDMDFPQTPREGAGGTTRDLAREIYSSLPPTRLAQLPFAFSGIVPNIEANRRFTIKDVCQGN